MTAIANAMTAAAPKTELSTHVAQKKELVLTIQSTDDKVTVTRSHEDELRPEVSHAVIKTVAPILADSLQSFATDAHRNFINNLFNIASIIDKEFNSTPGYEMAAEAVEAMSNPELFVFDKDTVIKRDDEHGAEEVMSFSEVAARRAAGLKPLSGGQFIFMMDSSERALDYRGKIKALAAVGVRSTETNEELWALAMKNKETRDKTFQMRQELEATKKKERSMAAMKDLTKPGGMLDI